MQEHTCEPLCFEFAIPANTFSINFHIAVEYSSLDKSEEKQNTPDGVKGLREGGIHSRLKWSWMPVSACTASYPRTVRGT